MKFNFLFLLIIFFTILSIPQNSFCQNDLTNKEIKNFFNANTQKKSNSNTIEKSDYDPSEDIDVEMIDAKKLAKENNIDPKSKWYKNIEYRLENEENFEKNDCEEKEVLFKIESKEELLDLSFENKKPLTKKPVKVRSKDDSEPKQKSNEGVFDHLFTPPPIPSCTSSFKETFPNPISEEIKLDEEKDGPIYFDSLLLSEKVLNNLDKETIINSDFFGSKNTVNFYSTKPYDMFSLSLKEKGIKCLPLRVIVTKDMITHYYGVDALKNYELVGYGVLNWKVEKNLDKFMAITKDNL